MKDHLVKAVADGVRVYAAVTTDLVNEAIRRHGCHPVAAAALGRTMTGALLLAANLKNREALTVTFDGHGPLGKVTADATPEGFVRGYVTNPYVDLPQNAKGKIDVGGGVGTDGTVTVTRFTGLRNPVTGSAPLTDGEIADDLTTTELAFRCPCSKERISEVLLSLGKSDLESLIEDGHAEVCCHFCNERYQFSKEELQAIYDKAMAHRQQES